MGDRDRQWWQEVKENVFVEKLGTLDEFSLHELTGDLSALINKLEAQKQRGGPDRDWFERLKYAQAMVVTRRKLVKAELSSRGVEARTKNHERKRLTAARIRGLLDKGDLEGAVRALVDSFDPDQKTYG